MFWNKKVIDKIYMGCGDYYKNGYVGCDVKNRKDGIEWKVSTKRIEEYL